MKNYIKAVAITAVAALGLAACNDDEYTSRGDLFQPRFACDPAVTVSNNNDVYLLWYTVNDAVGYTVQFYYDVYYQNLYKELETTDSYVNLEDFPYGTRFYVRVRSNAANPEHNSQWAICNFTTEARPDYAQILQAVSKTEIGDNDAVIRWLVDTTNPADSFSVAPATATDVPTISGYLSAEAKASGEMTVTGLTPSTLYNVNIYDTSKPRTYDKPYNTVTFRTTGPAPATIYVGLTDDLSEMLKTNNEDPDIPEGTVYSIPAGGSYVISTFSIQKGFKVVGDTSGDCPVITLNGTWNIASGAYISEWGFENVELRNAAAQQYFFNSGNTWELERVTLTNVKFVNIMRGFWRHQSSNLKHIQEFEIENCWFDKCGWQSGTYGTFYFGSAGKGEIGAYDQIDALTIRNTTFSRGGYSEDTSYGWGNLINHSMSSCPINLTIENVTFYDFCVNNRLIDLSSTERSQVTIRNVIIASPMGELLSNGSGQTLSYYNNYATTDYKLGGSQIGCTSTGGSADDLFVNPEGGDYTIKDHSSTAYMTGAGDQRWLK